MQAVMAACTESSSVWRLLNSVWSSTGTRGSPTGSPTVHPSDRLLIYGTPGTPRPIIHDHRFSMIFFCIMKTIQRAWGTPFYSKPHILIYLGSPESQLVADPWLTNVEPPTLVFHGCGEATGIDRRWQCGRLCPQGQIGVWSNPNFRSLNQLMFSFSLVKNTAIWKNTWVQREATPQIPLYKLIPFGFQVTLRNRQKRHFISRRPEDLHGEFHAAGRGLRPGL